jgi:hypothetical protein
VPRKKELAPLAELAPKKDLLQRLIA